MRRIFILSASYYQFGVNLKAIFPLGEKSTIYVAASCKYSVLMKNFTTTAMVPIPRARISGGTSTPVTN